MGSYRVRLASQVRDNGSGKVSLGPAGRPHAYPMDRIAALETHIDQVRVKCVNCPLAERRTAGSLEFVRLPDLAGADFKCPKWQVPCRTLPADGGANTLPRNKYFFARQSRQG